MTTRHIFVVITQGEEGGAQQFIRLLTEHADRTRFRFTVAWGGVAGDFLARTLPAHVERIIIPGLTRVGFAPLRDMATMRELRRLIRHAQPDTLLLISSKAGFLGSLAARGLRGALPDLKVIYRIGGWTFNDPWPAWKRRLFLTLERWSARWKDVIVVNNRHDFDQANKLGIRPREHVMQIANGIDPYLPVLSREEARSVLDRATADQYHKRSYTFLVGTIANFYPAKDLATLIRVASRVGGDVRFIVIGDGELRPELDRLIGTERLRDRFFLAGRIPDASRLLPAFDVFILPSVKEGFPWALLEAMTAKVPAVATRVGAVPEMIDDGDSGLLVAPGDVAGMVRAIVRLRDDEHLRREVAIAAHQKVINEFSLRTMISEFERLFS